MMRGIRILRLPTFARTAWVRTFALRSQARSQAGLRRIPTLVKSGPSKTKRNFGTSAGHGDHGHGDTILDRVAEFIDRNRIVVLPTVGLLTAAGLVWFDTLDDRRHKKHGAHDGAHDEHSKHHEHKEHDHPKESGHAVDAHKPSERLESAHSKHAENSHVAPSLKATDKTVAVQHKTAHADSEHAATSDAKEEIESHGGHEEAAQTSAQPSHDQPATPLDSPTEMESQSSEPSDEEEEESIKEEKRKKKAAKKAAKKAKKAKRAHKKHEEQQTSDTAEEDEDGHISADTARRTEEVATTGQKEVESGSEEIIRVKYVIVGAGTAAYGAIHGILEQDHNPDNKILVIGNEPYVPYSRPPLSKELWFHAAPDPHGHHDNHHHHSLYYTDHRGAVMSAFFELPVSAKPRVTLALRRAVVELSVDLKAVALDDGSVVVFDKCLLATGGVPRLLPNVDRELQMTSSRISTFRTIDDFRRLDRLSRNPDGTLRRIAVVGAGFLGCELAVALASRAAVHGYEVVHIFPEHGVMANVLPRYLSDDLTDKMRARGITMRAGRFVAAVDTAEADNMGLKVTLDNGECVDVDHMVVAIGIEPNVALGAAANLEVDSVRGGLVVNEELEARKDIFVAGDASSYYDAVLGRRRVEHFDHAYMSGVFAGRNMAGKHTPYVHQSAWWSDLEGIVSFEAVGLVDSTLPTYGVWEKRPPRARVDIEVDGQSANAAGEETNSSPYDRGVVYYLKEGRVVGVLLWNLPGRVNEARNIISYEGPLPVERKEQARRLATLIPMELPGVDSPASDSQPQQAADEWK